MNLKIIVITACIAMNSFIAKAEYREFTNTEGKTIMAELISYDGYKKKVTIKCKGKRNQTVPISIFSEEDQKYIVSWSVNQDFLSEKKLKVSFTRWKDKDEEGTYSNGGEDFQYYDCFFTIEFDNRSTVDFNDVKLDYVIFYTQEHHVRGKVGKKEERGTLYVRETIDLPKKSTKDFNTEKVVRHRYKVGANNMDWTDLESDVHGIMVNLSLKTGTGEKLTRRIRYPDDLKHPWTPRTENVQILP